jgi:HD-like signal output (HDOD) protein
MPVVAPMPARPFPREKLLLTARSLPADLQVLSELGLILQDVNSDLGDVARLLRRDLALSARIVRIGNSVVFGGGGHVATIEDAVNRVGFSEVLKLVGTATASRFTERSLDRYGIGAQKLRDNMLYGAIAAEALARVAGADPRLAYAAGLLRPLGLMVLDRAAHGALPPGEAYAEARWDSYARWEGSVFGISNCEVAAMILEEWRFPAKLCQAVRAQYLAGASDFEHPLAALLNVANGLAHQCGRSFPGESRWWGLTERKLEAAGVGEEHIEPAVTEMEREFQAASAALHG